MQSNADHSLGLGNDGVTELMCLIYLLGFLVSSSAKQNNKYWPYSKDKRRLYAKFQREFRLMEILMEWDGKDVLEQHAT